MILQAGISQCSMKEKGSNFHCETVAIKGKQGENVKNWKKNEKRKKNGEGKSKKKKFIQEKKEKEMSKKKKRW